MSVVTLRRRPRHLPAVVALLLLTGLLSAAAASSPSATAATVDARCGDAGTPAVVALHNPHLYVDTAVELWSSYAGYRVQAGAAAQRGLWLELADFTGGVVTLAPDQPGAVALPDLAGGGSTTQYLMLAATQATTVPQQHTVRLLDGPPGIGSVVCSRTFTYLDVVDTIKALANKVTSVSDGGAPATARIGETVTVEVRGNTGTLGAGPANDPGVLQSTPNALREFPVSAWRLERTEVTISPDGVQPARTWVDRP